MGSFGDSRKPVRSWTARRNTYVSSSSLFSGRGNSSSPGWISRLSNFCEEVRLVAKNASTQVERSSGGFDTHFAGSPLFAVATLSCRPTLAGVTTTTTLQQRSSCPLLALFNPANKMNRFPDRATWRRRTLRSSSCIHTHTHNLLTPGG